MVSTNEFLYLRDLEKLDSIGLGMLEPSNLVKHPVETRNRLASRGFVRVVDERHPYGEPVCYLTTKGKRAFQRFIKRQIAKAKERA